MKKFLLTILLLILAGGFIGFTSVKSWYDNAIFRGNSELAGDVFEYEVVEGATFIAVVEDLIELGLATDKTAVQLYLRSEGINPNIKMGKFRIPADINIPDLITILQQNTLKPSTAVTILEGLKYEEISEVLSQALASSTTFNSGEFISIVENPDTVTFNEPIQSFLNTHKPSGKNLRGFIFPDTYLVDEGSTTQQVVEQILNNFITQVSKNIDLSNPSENQQNFTDLYSALTLASIIEKEASKWDNRADISSVFHNRLRIGEPLGSDATVNFFTGKNDAGILFADRDTQNPYNTYLNTGLPPTPINNPRLESIIAAFKPSLTSNLFFYHTPDGRTFFNETMSGHQRGVCRDLGC